MRAIRFPVICAIAFMVGCRERNVGAIKTELSDIAYEREVTAPRHVVKVRYLPPLLRFVSERGLSDSILLTPGGLAEMRPIGSDSAGMCFLMRVDPIPSGDGAGFHDDLIFGNTNGFGGYRQALEGFGIGMKDRIWLELHGRKIALADYRMENNFGMSRGRNFLLVFPSPAPHGVALSGDVVLVLDDIVPGLSRRKLTWALPVGKHDETI